MYNFLLSLVSLVPSQTRKQGSGCIPLKSTIERLLMLAPTETLFSRGLTVDQIAEIRSGDLR